MFNTIIRNQKHFQLSSLSSIGHISKGGVCDTEQIFGRESARSVKEGSHNLGTTLNRRTIIAILAGSRYLI